MTTKNYQNIFAVIINEEAQLKKLAKLLEIDGKLVANNYTKINADTGNAFKKHVEMTAAEAQHLVERCEKLRRYANDKKLTKIDKHAPTIIERNEQLATHVMTLSGHLDKLILATRDSSDPDIVSMRAHAKAIASELTTIASQLDGSMRTVEMALISKRE
jgi:hypothetical protein